MSVFGQKNWDNFGKRISVKLNNFANFWEDLQNFQHHNLEKRKYLGRAKIIQAILLFKTRNFQEIIFRHLLFVLFFVCAFFPLFLGGWIK